MKLTKEILWIFLFISATLSAQKTHIVKGKILDFHDKSPQANASIILGKLNTISDINGVFIFKNVPAGEYTLSATHPDCDPFTEVITVDRDLDITVTIEHHVEDIEEVTIHGIHKNNGSMVLKTLSEEDISRNSSENLGNLLSKISGVGSLRTGNSISKPIIHGLYGSRVTIMNNGVKMAEQEWGAEHAPNVDINQFEHIDVIKGASTLKYGNGAIGGVVVLQPEINQKKDSLKGNVGISGISNGRGIALDARISRTWENGWFVNTGGGYKKTGDMHSPDYNLWNTGIDFQSFSFSAGNQNFARGLTVDYSVINQEIGIFRGSHIGNLEDFYRVINSQEPFYQRKFSYEIENPKQEVQHHIAKISAFKRFENIGKISANYSFQYNHRKEYDVRKGDLYDVPALDLELYTNSFNVNHLIERAGWNLESGIDASYQYNYSTPETQARRLVPNYNQYGIGLYSILKNRITKNFDTELGVRIDRARFDVRMWYDISDWENLYAADFSQFYVSTSENNRVFTKPQLDFDNLSLNAGFNWRPSDHLELQFNYAKVSRTPNIAELFSNGLHHSAAVVEVGNMALKNENGHQFNLHFSSKLLAEKRFEWSINPYFFITKNFINQVPTGVQNTIRGIFPVWEYQQVDAHMFGIDLDAQFAINEKLSYRGSFSYVYGQDMTNAEPLILMLPPNFSNQIEFRHPQWKKFYFTLSNATFLRQNRFPIHNPEIPLFENGVETTKTVDLSTPPPAYSLWGAQIGMEVLKNFSANLKVENMFNADYRDYLNRMRFFSQDVGRNFVLQLNYKF